MVKKLVKPLLLLPLFIFLTSYTCLFCKKAGIRGIIYRVQGNQMPSPGEPASAPQPFQTVLYVYELTNLSQVQPSKEPTFYEAIHTKLVVSVKSDKKGAFKVKLPPGNYSVFIKKDNLYYANIFDDKQNIAPVAVEKGKFTELTVKADYGAVY